MLEDAREDIRGDGKRFKSTKMRDDRGVRVIERGVASFAPEVDIQQR